MWGSSNYARDDLLEYRQHYPRKREEPNAWANVTCYRNETRMPSGSNLLIEEFMEKKFGDYGYLESAHDFIQQCAMIQEKGLNWSAQILQKNEIATIRSDAKILERTVRMFELLLDFWGFVLESKGDPELFKPRLVRLTPEQAARANIAEGGSGITPAAAAAASQPQPQQNSGDDDGSSNASKSAAEDNDFHADAPVYVGDGNHRLVLSGALLDAAIAAAPTATPAPNGGAVIRRKDDFDECFDNLNTSSHNYLRITRVLKWLGECGLEHYKVAFLEAFERELCCEKPVLYNVADSYQNYFVGTIYDDEVRAGFAERAKVGLAKARAAKEAAWQARGWGGGAYSYGGASYSYGGGASAVVVNDAEIDLGLTDDKKKDDDGAEQQPAKGEDSSASAVTDQKKDGGGDDDGAGASN